VSVGVGVGVGLRVVLVIVSVVVNDTSHGLYVAELAAVTVSRNRECNQLLYNVPELTTVTVLKNRDW
jgi:hypothetical protein